LSLYFNAYDQVCSIIRDTVKNPHQVNIIFPDREKKSIEIKKPMTLNTHFVWQ
jgi:hypothetical protein